MTHQDKKDSPKGKFTVYVVPGDPVPLARARLTKESRMWDSQKQTKLVYSIQLANQHEGKPMFTGPLHIEVVFYMRIAAAKKGKQLAGTYHCFRPDIDNLLKFIADVATGVLYHEDCIIASVATKKVYDDEPRTELIIIPLEIYGEKNEREEKPKQSLFCTNQ